MNHAVHNKIVSFIWSIADDCLRDVYVRGKYRDVILPMTVLRRIDSLLQETKEAVMEEVRFQREVADLTTLDPAGLRDAAGYVFYNTSPFTLNRLAATATNNRQRLEQDFHLYLNGFSDNVKEIIDKFNLRSKVSHMAAKDVLLDVLEKFTSPYINLTPRQKIDPDGRIQPPLTNLGMGYVFEELIRKFNEENNEEAGEHFTPREVIRLMTHLVFDPIKNNLPPNMLVYDPACGSGGMLTESKNYLVDPNGPFRMSETAVKLYGIEVNDETYAICKADMLIKDDNPENIRNGSTLATNLFSGLRFDFMLSNPPYGKSWKSDKRYIVDGRDVIDERFRVRLPDYRGEIVPEDATPRSSDGQLLFLMDMVAKLKPPHQNQVGSRIASVHNGSSLFTGDAGSGESNIRRHIIENDWLEAIIQLPENLFYNTGITTYIWLLNNNKPAARRGKVQLVDGSDMYRKLRKNLGAKNCELSPDHIAEITGLIGRMEESDTSQIFNNREFGYYKVTVERPLRQKAQFTPDRIAPLRYMTYMEEVMEWAYDKWGDEIIDTLDEHADEMIAYAEEADMRLTAGRKRKLRHRKRWLAEYERWQAAAALMDHLGREVWADVNELTSAVDAADDQLGLGLYATDKRKIIAAVSWADPDGAKVVAKTHKLKGKKLARLRDELACTVDELPHHGYWPTDQPGVYVEYETDTDLRDTENVPLGEGLAEGTDAPAVIRAYFLREVRPHVPDAWIVLDKTKIGYEISFNKYFYQHTPLRPLEEVTAEILELEAETEGLLKELVQFGAMTNE